MKTTVSLTKKFIDAFVSFIDKLNSTENIKPEVIFSHLTIFIV